ncbi:MAG: hypothetical protein ACTSQE_14990, partial [Candidatus Heimdallarchaeaceae archaeon]
MKSNPQSNTPIRIAPSSLCRFMVLFLLLSVIFLPSPYLSQGLPSDNQRDISSINFTSFSLFNENMEFIAGKNDSLLASLELQGGTMDLPLEFSYSTLLKISSFSLIVANQSNYLDVWTNPLWKYPSGLSLIFSINSIDEQTIQRIILEIQNEIRTAYNVNMSVFHLHSFVNGVTEVSLAANIPFSTQLEIFKSIFPPKDEPVNGNFVSVLYSHFLSSPSVYAYGFSVSISRAKVTSLYRKAFLSLNKHISTFDEKRILSLNELLKQDLIPDSQALFSIVKIRFPFFANVTSVSPNTDNVAPKITGTFEWVLQTPVKKRYTNFSAEISYFISSVSTYSYPRVIATNSYSDTLLNENGTLNMNYEIQNIGSEAAINTTLRVPIPPELEYYVKDNRSLPVLNKKLVINESFVSEIILNISIPEYPIYAQDLILKIQGWYENLSTSSLERWNDTTELPLYKDNIILRASNGLPSDLLKILVEKIIPELEKYDNIIALWYDREQILNNLSLAVLDTFDITFHAFYELKPLFEFNSSDFQYVFSPFGSYLVCVIPLLKANESINVNWKIENIPTQKDDFGALLYDIQPNEDALIENHAIFTTKKSDYWSLMVTHFVKLNASGRVLSTYDLLNDTFINLGSRFKYSDKDGQEYYGLTNGVNLQIGDDEAILESKLTSDKSLYRVGELLTLELNITNRGSISAYDIYIDIVNLKLNYLWQPTDVIEVKSFHIDSLEAGESIFQAFQIKANSYIGLNTYVAFVRFISDKDQLPVSVTDPWTNETLTWKYSGEAHNIVSSTLTSGLLLPPLSLSNKSRPSFPLPELEVSSSYELSSDNKVLTVQYIVENVGLSSTNVSIFQLMDNLTYQSLQSVTTVFNETSITPEYYEYLSYIRINLAKSLQLAPGEKLVITEIYTNLSQGLIVPPLIIDYLSLYEILTTDFQPVNVNQQQETLDFSYALHLAPENVTESDQNKFAWTTYSPTIEVPIPTIEEPENRIEFTFPDIPNIYPIITAGVATIIVVLISMVA